MNIDRKEVEMWRKERDEAAYSFDVKTFKDFYAILKDCGTACEYWQDDAQIASEIVSKKYSKDSGIVFVAEEMEADNE